MGGSKSMYGMYVCMYGGVRHRVPVSRIGGEVHLRPDLVSVGARSETRHGEKPLVHLLLARAFSRLREHRLDVYVCMYVCMYIYVCICWYYVNMMLEQQIDVCMYVYMYVCI